MDIQASKIARHYAQAFLNVYPCTLSLQEYERLRAAVVALHSSGRLSTLLKISLLSPALKKRMLLAWFTDLQIPCDIAPLLDLLIEHQRLYMFTAVLGQLCHEYAERHGIIDAQIQSTYALPGDKQLDICEFIERTLGKRVSATFVVKKKLIAGIRLQGTNFLWEHSLRQRLSACARNVV